jgi:hypothetical protein
VTNSKPDEVSAKIVDKLKETKLKEIGVFSALSDLTDKSKTCLLSELHLVAYKSLTGQQTLYEGCVAMEEIAKTKVLPVADQLDRKVKATSSDP